ncbi:MAG: succinylglutamate desuccinylase/aspartoacylase family protein [Planctomycetes bacterium]|nr:succinylglutamate desuccinylase/aspartoacylase family protein [Planctomycetota bacterium]
MKVGGEVVVPGERRLLELPTALLPTLTPLHLPVAVANGLEPGPRLWLSAAVHGDELNGVEVIRRVLEELPQPLPRGALLAVPIVNVFGFIGQSRYLPDRRDLNRSFPGSKRGSLAGRIANLFMAEVVAHCTHGIDLHTAAQDRSNLPQVRGDFSDAEVLRMARVFAAPAMVDLPKPPRGALRAAAARRGIAVMVYEGGEALRFNEPVIDAGVRGILRVMRELGMIPPDPTDVPTPTVHVDDHTWIRARRGGLLRLDVDEGAHVAEGELLGVVADAFGSDRVSIRAPFAGLVIGKTNNPVVHGGDPLVNLGRVAAEE